MDDKSRRFKVRLDTCRNCRRDIEEIHGPSGRYWRHTGTKSEDCAIVPHAEPSGTGSGYMLTDPWRSGSNSHR